MPLCCVSLHAHVVCAGVHIYVAFDSPRHVVYSHMPGLASSPACVATAGIVYHSHTVAVICAHNLCCFVSPVDVGQVGLSILLNPELGVTQAHVTVGL